MKEGLDDCSANMDICKQHLTVTKSFDSKQSQKKIDIGIEFRLVTWLPLAPLFHRGMIVKRLRHIASSNFSLRQL